MSDLLNEDTLLLSAVGRFGISLGFGDKCVKDACEANGIDSETFLAVVNFLAEGNVEINETMENVSLKTVVEYLKNAHVYYLNYKLPSVRSRLVEAIDSSNQSIPYREVFLKFFDEYFAEVRNHMEYEDFTLFPYVMRLLEGELDRRFNIAVFEEHHTDIETKLDELKKILIKYYPGKGTNYLLTDVLLDLLWCERDIDAHNQVENFFLVPLIEALEQKLKQK
jgi:regulator of cell morphogenesis and NO signaling